MLRKNLSTEHTEGTDGWELDGIFLGSLRLEILGEIFFKNGWGPEINHRNLNGIKTELFFGSLRLEILGEIFFKMLLTQEIYSIPL